MKKGVNTSFFISVLLTFMLLLLSEVSTVEFGDMTILEYIISKHNKDNVIELDAIMHLSLQGMWFSIVLPMLCSIPKLFQFNSCIKTENWRFNMIRTGHNKFKLNSWMQVTVSGSMAIVFGYLIFFIVMILLFPIPDSESLSYYSICTFTKYNSIYIILLSTLIIIFLFSMLTGSICILLYSLTENIYKSIIFPITGYYILSCISESLYRKKFDLRMAFLSPKYILGGTDYTFENTFNFPYFILPVILFLITLALCLFYLVAMGKRLRT